MDKPSFWINLVFSYFFYFDTPRAVLVTGLFAGTLELLFGPKDEVLAHKLNILG